MLKDNFLITSCDLRTTTAGKPFISGIMKSTQGHSCPFVKWDCETVLIPGEVYYIAASEGTYMGLPQFTIKAFALVADADKSPWEVTLDEKSYNMILSYVDCIIDEELRVSIKQLFNEYKQEFLRASGAVALHHTYVGGLADHTLEVLENSLNMAPSASNVNKDVLIAAAALHDWGKIKAYSVSDIGVIRKDEHYYSTDHIIDTLVMFRSHIFADDIDLLQQIEHCIISHHGKLEWGALKEPSSKEAIIMHYADMLSAQFAYFDNYDGTVNEFGWTDNRVFPMGRHLFIGKEED